MQHHPFKEKITYMKQKLEEQQQQQEQQQPFYGPLSGTNRLSQ